MATKFNNQPFLAVAAGVAAITFSGFASAQTSASPSPTSASPTPTTTPSPTSASPAPSTSATPTSYSSHDPTSTNSPVATQLIRSTSLQQMLNISSALATRAAAFRVPPSLRADTGERVGMAAGNGAAKWNAWGSLSGDSFEYSGGIGTPAVFDADTTNTVFGADYALTPALALGLSVAFDNVSGTGGAVGATTGFKNDGYTIAPYLGWQINNEYSLDATMGWGEGKLSQSGVETKPDRFFYGANLNYIRWSGNWQATGKLSYLHGEEEYENSAISNASKNKVGQWRIGAQVGYWMNGVLPYFGVSYSSDSRSTATGGILQPTDDLGKDAWLWSLGVNIISLKNNLTGGISYNTESGRDHAKRDTLMANINYRF